MRLSSQSLDSSSQTLIRGEGGVQVSPEGTVSLFCHSPGSQSQEALPVNHTSYPIRKTGWLYLLLEKTWRSALLVP